MLTPPSFFKIARFVVAFQICFLLKGSLSSNNDMISSLPGQPPVGFKQYAGYIPVDEKGQRALFYYFVEAETDPQTKPLVLWLNGGPGCSSIGAGAFTEHGPFKPKGDGLIRNNYSWNKEANMLYLESPAGVGFSYSSNKSFYGYINDKMTATDNLNFLLRWLEAYPEYKSRDFFITGESYGGHYVPQLASLVLTSKLKPNLKGIAIGNPLLEFGTDFNAKGEFYWSHGLISDSTYSMLNSICNYSEINRQSIQGQISPACLQVYNQASDEVGKFIDVYDVIIDVCLSSSNSSSQAKALSPIYRLLGKIDKLGGLDVCVEDETTKYLNRKDVQTAFNVNLVGGNQWSLCSNIISYDYEDLLVPSLPLLGTLVKSGVRVLVYSGDQDSAIPLLGTRSLVSSLAKNLGLNTAVPYKYWLQNRQVGGWTQVYGDILSFATIRGASHIAPFTQPERSLLLFSTFLAGKTLAQAN